MGQTKIIRIFLENPNKHFQIRGISRQFKIPKTTVSYHIGNLIKKHLIKKQEKGIFPSYRANTENPLYRFHKTQEALRKITESGLISYLEQECTPKAIMLFGSFAKAEYDEKSDIDLFVQAKETKVNLEKFEKKLKHAINIIFEPEINKLSPELLNNIINGIKLSGFLKIK
jgi:predicted nucleotidyltransferase